MRPKKKSKLKPTPCFFCDVQKEKNKQILFKTKSFFVRFDSFPVNPGHVEIVTKKHTESFFDLNITMNKELFSVCKKVKTILDRQFNPEGYTIGINEGPASGRTIAHFHLHIIPRFKGDVANCHGGVRNIIPKKSNYVMSARKISSNIKYLKHLND